MLELGPNTLIAVVVQKHENKLAAFSMTALMIDSGFHRKQLRSGFMMTIGRRDRPKGDDNVDKNNQHGAVKSSTPPTHASALLSTPALAQ